MNELFNQIWNMSAGNFLLLIGGILFLPLCFIGYVFYQLFFARSRAFNEMDRDFKAMRRKVRSNLEK